MAKKGLTKKQFLYQTASCYTNLAMGVLWLVMGIREHKPFEWIMGAVFMAIAVTLFLIMFIQWKRNPVVDEELDRKLTQDAKEQMKNAGIMFAVIAGGFLLAFGLVFLLT